MTGTRFERDPETQAFLREWSYAQPKPTRRKSTKRSGTSPQPSPVQASSTPKAEAPSSPQRAEVASVHMVLQPVDLRQVYAGLPLTEDSIELAEPHQLERTAYVQPSERLTVRASAVQRVPMASLSDLTSRAVPYEAQPVEFDRWLRWGAIAGVAFAFAYLLTTALILTKIRAPMARPGFFVVGWGFFLKAAFLNGHLMIGVDVAEGTLALGAIGILASGFRRGPRWTHHLAGLVALAGMAAAIPLLLMLGVLAANTLWVVVKIVFWITVGYFVLSGLGALLEDAF